MKKNKKKQARPHHKFFEKGSNPHGWTVGLSSGIQSSSQSYTETNYTNDRVRFGTSASVKNDLYAKNFSQEFA